MRMGVKNITNFLLGRFRWPGLIFSISGMRGEISGWKSPFWILGWKLLLSKFGWKLSKLASGLAEFYPDWVRGKNQEAKLGKQNNSCCIYKLWLFVNWLDYGFIWHFCGTDYYMLSFLIRIWSIFWSWIIMKMVKVNETKPHKWLMVPRLIVISEDNCHVRGRP